MENRIEFHQTKEYFYRIPCLLSVFYALFQTHFVSLDWGAPVTQHCDSGRRGKVGLNEDQDAWRGVRCQWSIDISIFVKYRPRDPNIYFDLRFLFLLNWSLIFLPPPPKMETFISVHSCCDWKTFICPFVWCADIHYTDNWYWKPSLLYNTLHKPSPRTVYIKACLFFFVFWPDSVASD